MHVIGKPTRFYPQKQSKGDEYLVRWELQRGT